MIDPGYLDFVRSKLRFGRDVGIDVDPAILNPMLSQHQRDLVVWAARKGRAALFAAFGLGKTFMQIELARVLLAALAVEAPRGEFRALIVAPLGVRREFFRDAVKLGVAVRFVRTTADVEGAGIFLANYESVRDGKLSLDLFQVASLDEASVLRSFGSKTYQEFLPLFERVRWRFVATATPSPNSYKELIHYAGFLGVMDTGQALTRFFQRDPSEAGNLTLFPHMEREFHLWLHSWAAFVQRPSDLGYLDLGYDMPELVVRWHEVPLDGHDVHTERDGQTALFRSGGVSLSQAAADKRDSLGVRIARMTEILAAAPGEHFVIWHDLEAERHAIADAVPEAVISYGSLDLEERERRVSAFADGEVRILASKPVLEGSGVNFQRHCHRAVFLGIGFKFNDFIQAIHRIRRFLQPHQCEVDLIYAETERDVRRVLERKWAEHEDLTERMSALIRVHGLSTLGMEVELARTIGVERVEERGSLYHAVHNDCVIETSNMEANSIDLIVTSIPFGNHYEYSERLEDFGHNDDNSAFFRQMDFLTPQLLRILKPGRLAAVHAKDRVRFGAVTGLGMSSVDPFHADCIAHYRRHGFVFCGMIHVNTDVVRENNQTYRLGWTEQCKDGTKMGVGSSEYVLLLRKLPSDTSRSYADMPVTKEKAEYTRGRWQIDAHAFWRSSGDRLMTAEDLSGYGPDRLAKLFPRYTLQAIYDYRQHVAVADALDAQNKLPATFGAISAGAHQEHTWDDVNRMRTLNGEQSGRNLVQHICPLQFDIVDRLIERFSNPGELVFDPFGGLGTVPYCAMKLGRRGQCVELNGDYYRDSLRYLREAEAEASLPTLFAMEQIGSRPVQSVAAA